MISSSYDIQTHLQCSERRWWLFWTTLQWFEVLPDLLLELPGAPRGIFSTPRLVIGAPSLVFSSTRCVVGKTSFVLITSECLQACSPRAQVLPRLSPDLLWPAWFVARIPRCTSRPLRYSSSGIWPPWDSGPITSRHSKRLPERRIHIADV